MQCETRNNITQLTKTSKKMTNTLLVRNAAKQQVEIPNENQFLSFETARVQTLTMAQLRRTILEHDIYGKPVMGIYHVDFLQRVLDLATTYGLNAEVFDLFAANNKDKKSAGVVILPELEKKFGERAVEAHVLRRVFCNIRLHDFDTAEYTTNLSIAFHQGGIQVGFGNNVIICHNQCMLNAELYAATYGREGREKHQIEELLGIVAEWFKNAKDLVNGDREKIKRMKAIELTADDVYRTIGMLTAIRVANETKHEEIRNSQVLPLNQAQIGKVTELLLLRFHENNKVTLWDLYDCATEQYKADSMDMSMILPQNLAMVRFLENTYMAA